MTLPQPDLKKLSKQLLSRRHEPSTIKIGGSTMRRRAEFLLLSLPHFCNAISHHAAQDEMKQATNTNEHCGMNVERANEEGAKKS